MTFGRRLAHRHTFATFDAFGRGADRTTTAGAGVLVFSSLLLYGLILALVVTGIWLCMISVPGVVVGLLVIGLAVLLRPRLGRAPKYATEVVEKDAPQLHALVREAAAAVGAPSPRIYVEGDSFGAEAGEVGLRRRPILVLGLPLWNALPRQARMALLGHELGHFVNGDPRRGLLVQPSWTTLAELDRLLQPESRQDGDVWTEEGFLVVWIVRPLLNLVKAVLRGLLWAPRTALAVLVLREGQRAEYRADRVAARMAGRAATAELLDTLVVMDSLAMLIMRDARAGRPVAEWPETTRQLLAEVRPQLAARRDAATEREISLFATHPPSGLRARLVEATAGESAAVVLDSARNERIDAELARHSASSARTLKAL
ncbi:M48 family metalloprotease [Dactylosporangium sp. NBC_01737]|uniref:M48 family metallopeptidase n=1 Tax=Dactylosporangium sp. NBC_01737 TaxID=2975959 RepID=UPI002E14D110|nr:M48 family metalloprotease [Dactylosporangium sp. NBC_01737]